MQIIFFSLEKAQEEIISGLIISGLEQLTMNNFVVAVVVVVGKKKQFF